MDLGSVEGGAIAGVDSGRKLHHPAAVRPLTDLAIVLRDDLATDFLVAAPGSKEKVSSELGNYKSCFEQSKRRAATSAELLALVPRYGYNFKLALKVSSPNLP